MQNAILAALGALAVAVAIALLDATAAWGAHPFWSGSVPLIGAGLALPLLILALRWPLLGLLASGAVAVAGGLSARLGKAEFAASFAENALAGRFWYFGWIVLCAGLTALIAIAILTLLRRARPA